MKHFSLLYFIIFICTLLVGYSISNQFALQGPNSAAPSPRIITISGEHTIKTMPNGQRSILLIGTSNMHSTNPSLESAWLVTYFPSDTLVRLLPIHPSGKQVVSDFESLLSQSFSIEKINGTFTLGQEFITVLEKHNYWWSGYIIFDDQALLKIVDAVDGIDMQGQILMGEQFLAEYHNTLNLPLEAYELSVSVLQSTCRKISALSGYNNLSQLASLIPDHLSTDMDLSQILADWQSLSDSNQSPTCRFPLQDVSLQVP
jgi:anionic cell wall polymer biosynthesis LytR-Cps2A-Psr (LCP) family protein